MDIVEIDIAPIDLTPIDAVPIDVISFRFIPDDVPQEEADALIAFGVATGWEDWTNGAYRSGDPDAWGNSRTVGDWYGVTVLAGHVAHVVVPNIGLDGDAGTTLDPLAGKLVKIHLHQNPGLDNISLEAQTAANDINLSDCGWSTETVASVLDDLVTADVAPGTLNIGGTNAVPWDDGLVSLTTLDSRGWSLTFTKAAVLDVPQEEYDALMWFHIRTAGMGWTSRTNWLSATVGSWFGVTVAGGHVTALEMPNNNIIGNITSSFLPITILTLVLKQNTGIADIDVSLLTSADNIDLAGCDFGSAVVAGILANVVTAGVSAGTLDIGGSNSSPNPAGVTSLLALEADSWTLTYSTVVMENTGDFYAIMADGDATIRSSATDLSGQSAKYIVAYDGTNDKYAFAYGHAADDAEAFTEVVVNGDFSAGTNWSFDANWTWSGSTAVYNGTNAPQALVQNTLDEGMLYKGSVDVVSSSAALRMCFGSTAVYGSNITGTGTFERIMTSVGSSLLMRGYGAMEIDNISCLRYDHLGTDALQLRNALTGSTRNWTSIESGFNPNKISKIEVFSGE